MSCPNCPTVTSWTWEGPVVRPVEEGELAKLYEAVPLESRNAWRAQLGLPPEAA